MFFDDLRVTKIGNLFSITHNDETPILISSGTPREVKHSSEELIEFIYNDLGRLGSFEINNRVLEVDSEFCAYGIFSFQCHITEDHSLESLDKLDGSKLVAYIKDRF